MAFRVCETQVNINEAREVAAKLAEVDVRCYGEKTELDILEMSFKVFDEAPNHLARHDIFGVSTSKAPGQFYPIVHSGGRATRPRLFGAIAIDVGDDIGRLGIVHERFSGFELRIGRPQARAGNWMINSALWYVDGMDEFTAIKNAVTARDVRAERDYNRRLAAIRARNY